ncbi:MAG: osmoprotectant transporter activator [Noviherbaspirillum sp.]|nr:osmoprotectant transporter activator [Noviherbaspirillum sp.]
MNTPTPPTPPTNPAQSARALLKQFQERFPAFRNCTPLAIGIDKQLLALQPDLNRKVLRIALGIHTNSLRYLKAMEKAQQRFDLDGNAAGDVTDAQRAHASEILRERFRKDAEQRKTQREAEEAQRKAQEAEQRRIEKLNQLAAKFSKQR